MKWCPTHKFLVVIVATVCALLLAVSGYAQFQSGNIYGKVQAKDGSVLPGVTVTLTGIAAPQTTVSDAQGNFRFINLSPGTYTLKAELAGYGTATRSGISVRVAQNADVALTLNPSVAESITVTAEAPVLDVRKAGTGIDVSNVELQKVPTGRDPWVIMQQTPGVLVDRMNVGGNQSGQQSGYVSKGSGSGDSSWNVDGVNITDFGATGSTPTYYDFDTFEEMQITTGGSDPRIQTPGIQMNMVTKRGTNDFKGSGRWFQTNNNWQAAHTVPAEAQSYLKTTPGINRIEDRGIELGGPLWRDKAWFWGAFGRQNVNLFTATLTTSGTRGQDKTLLQNENIKFNAQPLSSNSFVATDMYGEKVKTGRNVGATRAPETGWNQGDIYAGGGAGSLTNPTMYKFEDTQIVGSSLYLTGLYSQVQGGFGLISDSSKGCTTVPCGIAAPVAYRDYAGDGSWHRSYETYTSVRPQHQARIDGSKFFDIGNMNHELKFGLGYRHAIVNSVSIWPGNQYVYTGVGSAGGDNAGVYLTRNNTPNYEAKYEDAYLGDTILMGNLTIQAAVRYDLQKGGNLPSTEPANPTVPDLLPAITTPGISGLKWTNITPRIGLTYALGANKRSLIRAAYNRYASQLDSGTVTRAGITPYTFLYYYFNDLNGDHVAQRNEIDFKYGLVGFSGVDPNHLGETTVPQFTRWASNLKAPKTDEFIVGFEHELLTDFSVGVNGTYRKMTDFTQTIGEHTKGAGDFYGPQDYVLHAPVTATLPNGTKVSLPYYTLAPGVAPPTYFVVRNNPGYTQNYKSIDLFATKRMSNRWMMRGNFTFQDWKQHYSESGIVDPTITRSCGSCLGSSDVIVGSGTGSGSFGGVYINSKWSYNITGLYQIPVVEATLGVNLFGRQGYAIPYVYRVGVAGEGNKYLQATTSDVEFRNPNVHELDLRLAKDLNFFRGRGVTLSIDAFNVLNSQTVLQRNVSRLNTGASNHITELMSPRVFRVGARFNF